MKVATTSSKRVDGSSLRAERLAIKWMMALVLAFQVAIFVKKFLH